jgi:hypothetical protein
MAGEGADAGDVGLDGPGGEVPELHVVDHPAAQRCHDALLCWDERAGGALIMAQQERGVGTEAGKTADVKREPVREGSEEGGNERSEGKRVIRRSTAQRFSPIPFIFWHQVSVDIT